MKLLWLWWGWAWTWLVLGQSLPPPVTWVPAPDDPNVSLEICRYERSRRAPVSPCEVERFSQTELLEPSFAPLYRTGLANEFTWDPYDWHSYCAGAFGASARMLRLPHEDRFYHLVQWMKDFNITRLRLAYRRRDKVEYEHRWEGIFFFEHAHEELPSPTVEANWADGFPKRSNTTFSTYISAEHDYKIVDDEMEFGEWDVVMLCERPANGDHSTHRNLDSRPTTPGWTRLSDRIQEAKLISDAGQFTLTGANRHSNPCVPLCSNTPSMSELADVEQYRELGRQWGFQRIWLYDMSKPRWRGRGYWLPGQPTEEQMSWYNLTSNEHAVLELGSDKASTGMRFARGTLTEPYLDAAVVCVRKLSWCAPVSEPTLLGPLEELRLRQRAAGQRSAIALTTVLADVHGLHQCAKLCRKAAMDASAHCGGLSFCGASECRLHHLMVSVDTAAANDTACDLFERF